MDPLAQDELPGREPLSDSVLYVRRERVFVLLASVFVASAALLPLLGTGKLFGASWIVRRFGYEPQTLLFVPFGALALPIALLALNLIGDLFGRRRARGLILTTLVVWIGVLGLLWATDHLADYDNKTTTAFWVGLVLVGVGFVTCMLQVHVFAWISVRWLRHVLAPLVGIAAAWGGFLLIARQLVVPGEPADTELLGVALGAGAYTWLVVVLGTIPIVIIAGTLSGYLRVALRRRRVVDDFDPGSSGPAFVSRRQRAQVVQTPVPGALKRPFTSEENAFFDAGEDLGKR